MKGALLVAVGSLISGCLLTLALPPGDRSWLGWFALVPLFMSIRGRGFLTGFLGGLIALFTMAFVAQQGWFYAHKFFSGNPAWLYTGCGLFGFSVSILAGAWADKGTRLKPVWWFAALAVLLEAVLLIQLPAHMALSQYRHPLMLLLASIGGIWLVSFLVWYFNLALAHLLLMRPMKPLVLLASGYLLILLTSSSWNLFPAEVDQTRKFGVVQTGQSDERVLVALHQSAVDAGASVVVWPEFAGIMFAPRGDTSELQRIAQESGGAIVTTYNDDFGPLPHNVASLVNSAGASDPYYKQKLFGGEKSMHTPGSRAAHAGHVALNICFDSCFPMIVRESARLPDVQVVALPTIDPESPHHFVALVHAAFTPFRSAESGVSIIRCDGFAGSMIVNSRGRILMELPPGESVGIGAISQPRTTLYRMLGDWFLVLAGVLVLAGLLWKPAR